MLAHPLLVAGPGRACSELMAAMGGTVAVKTGAEAVYTAILPAQGLGVALKIEDGATRASECAIAALLVRLGAVAADDPAVARRLNPAITSRRGFPAGSIRPGPGASTPAARRSDRERSVNARAPAHLPWNFNAVDLDVTRGSRPGFRPSGTTPGSASAAAWRAGCGS